MRFRRVLFLPRRGVPRGRCATDGAVPVAVPTRRSIRQSSTTPNHEPFAPKANATRTARALIREPSLDPPIENRYRPPSNQILAADRR